MKKVLLLGAALVLGLSVVAQSQLKSHTSYKASDKNAIAIDPLPTTQGSTVVTPRPNPVKSASTVTVLTLGTSANGLGWGYGGGQREHLWADQDLKSVAITHRMGPATATSPPSYSGYLAIDHSINYGATLADWKVNFQVHAATLNLTGSYYLDAGRYPQGGIYNPAGNTDTANAYLVYHAASFCDINNVGSTAPTWGGYVYGRMKWSFPPADSIKHLDWYAPPPKRDIPEGWTVTPLAKVFALDKNYSYGNGYDNNLYLQTGIWNAATSDFDYTASLIPCTGALGSMPATEKIQADPSGNHVWIAAIGCNGEGTHAFDSTYYPIFYHSSDGGATWGPAMSVSLDGVDGIPAIKNYISDARLAQVYTTVPTRDEIPYTCAFEGDLTVDKWGNPHLACVVCMPGGGFTIINPDGANYPLFDSTAAVFDIFTTDRGATWCARMMGVVKHMVGAFPSTTYPEYNRCNISRNAAGDKIFVTWNDTWVTSATDNSAPDIFARGWDLVTDKLTNNSGQDAGTNATYLSDVTQNAVCGDSPQLTFTKADNSSLIPMVCEQLTSFDMAQVATFKYVSDFRFRQDATVNDFTIDAAGPVWGSGCNFPVGINNQVVTTTMTASVYPNPVKGVANMKVTVPQKGSVTIQVTNLVGQTVMNLTRNVESTDTFNLDASQLTAGVYFYTVKQGSQKVSGKFIVE